MKRFWLRILTAIVAGLWLVSAGAADTTIQKSRLAPYDLLRLHKLALAHEPSLNAARYQREAEQEAASRSTAELKPTVNLSAEKAWERRWSQEQSFFGTSDREQRDLDQTVYQLVLSQPLFRAAAWYGLEAGRAEEQRAAMAFNATLQSFNQRFIETYIETLRAQTRLQTIREQLKAVKQQRQQSEAMLRAGMISKIDVIQASAEEVRVEAEMISANGAVEAQLHQLEALTGVPIGALAALNQRFDPERHDSLSVDRLLETALTQNPRVLQARLEVDQAEALTSQARAGHYPTVDLRVVASKSELDWDADVGPLSSPDSESESVRIGLNFNLPLYSGGRTSSAYREQRARELQAEANLQAIVADIRRQILVSHNQLINLSKTLVAARASMLAQQQALDATRRTYESGLKDMVDIVETQRELFNAQLQVENARFDYLLALSNLFQAVGRLEDDFIAKTNSWLGNT